MASCNVNSWICSECGHMVTNLDEHGCVNCGQWKRAMVPVVSERKPDAHEARISKLERRSEATAVELERLRQERASHRIVELENAVDDLERKLRELAIDHQSLARRAKVKKGKR